MAVSRSGALCRAWLQAGQAACRVSVLQLAWPGTGTIQARSAGASRISRISGPALLASMPSTQWRPAWPAPWVAERRSSSKRRTWAAGGLWAPSSRSSWPRQGSCCRRPGQQAWLKPVRMALLLMAQPRFERACSMPRATAPLLAWMAPGMPRAHGPKSRGSTQRSSAPVAVARCSSTAATSGLWAALMAVQPCWSTPAFSAAMAAAVGPRNSL